MTAPATPAAPTLAQTALGDLDQEMAITRRVLERVPDEHWDWKPHPKSFSLGQLAAHVANLPLWGEHTLANPGIDFAQPNVAPFPPAPNREAVLANFDAAAGRLRAALAGANDQALGETYTVRRGPQVFATMPKAAMVRNMVLSHTIHHRGQLTVYLRLLDVPVPSVYGPSADERPW